MRRSSLFLLLGLVLVAGSCRLTSDGGVVGVLTPGLTGNIQIVTTSVAGGHATIVMERVDSARRTLQVETCRQSVVGGDCDSAEGRTTFNLTQAELDKFFRLVSSAEFGAVLPAYTRAGDVVPPDPMQVRIDVTVRERTRTITWEKDAVVPKILLQLRCLMSTAGGSLSLCAETD